jgi:hypothetical protein
LNKKGLDWFPMRRSNKRDLHPLWFGLYDDLAYHHGAGFREPISRADGLGRLRVPPLCPRILREALQGIHARFSPKRRRVMERNRALSEQVYDSIVRDPFFYREFQT